MCVIVHQPKGEYLDKETAKKLWSVNSDGGGFAFIDDDGALQVAKSMDFTSFWSHFETTRSQFPRRDYLLHMRIATHGSVSLENVHPFVVDDYTVMAHNGIIHGVTPYIDSKTDDRSDTRYFIDEVLPRLPETWMDDPFLSDMVNEWVGWSRLMFLTTNPKLQYSVYRFGSWDEYEGLHLSNKNGLANKKSYSSTAFSFSDRQSQYSWEADDYKVPLPASESTSKELKPSEDWEMWQDYLSIRGDVDKFPLDEDEVDYLLEALRAERKATGIEHGIIQVMAEPLQLECFACYAEIDIETGECRCWDEVCSGCWQFVANCTMQGSCNSGNLFAFDTLTDRGKEFVNDGGLSKYQGTDKEVMAAAISEGEGNIKTA